MASGPEFRDDWKEGPTGRHLVTLKPGSAESKALVLNALAGYQAVSPADENKNIELLHFGESQAKYFPNIGVMVTDASPNKLMLIEGFRERGDVLAVEPERYVHALHAPPSYSDSPSNTWGLDAPRAAASSSRGTNIRIAVLDSGLDPQHPDFVHNLLRRNFVAPGWPLDDVFTHGTHVAGTICGRRWRKDSDIGFGVAPEAILYVGKVLDDNGQGKDADVLAGIEWALGIGADIISMSLGATAFAGSSWVTAYEQAASRALDRGCLVVAAAGNAKPGTPRLPVFSPANCPSILAVGAVDHHLQPEDYSSFGTFKTPGGVDLAGPGEEVLSTVPGSARYGRKSGTSMAAPHVSGCAALWASATGLRGRALWQRLCDTAVPTGAASDLVGYGLVQAPP